MTWMIDEVFAKASQSYEQMVEGKEAGGKKDNEIDADVKSLIEIEFFRALTWYS